MTASRSLLRHEQSFVAAFSPEQIPGLVAWHDIADIVDAGDSLGHVRFWPDRSPHHNNAVTWNNEMPNGSYSFGGTLQLGPDFRHSGLRCDWDNGRLWSPGIFNDVMGFTTFIVAAALPGGHPYIRYLLAQDGVVGFGQNFVNTVPGPNGSVFWQEPTTDTFGFSSQTTQLPEMKDSSPNPDFHLWEFGYDAASNTGMCGIDEQVDVRVLPEFNHQPRAHSTNGMAWGSLIQTDRNGSYVYKSVLAYARYLPTDERQLVEEWLRVRFSL